MKKLLWLSVCAAISAPVFANTESLELELKNLQKQQAALEKEINQLSGTDNASHGPAHVGPIGGHMIASNEFDGRGLQILQGIAKAEKSGEGVPLFTFGGTLQVDATYAKDATWGTPPTGQYPSLRSYSPDHNESQIYVDTARLDFLAHLNDWTNIELSYNVGGPIHTGSVLLGNLNKNPFYAQLGKFYPVFGLFIPYNVYTFNLTKNYFRPDSRPGASIGYNANGFHAVATVFKDGVSVPGGTGSPYNGKPNFSDANHLNNWSVEADYGFMMGKVFTLIGAGYVSNLTSANDNMYAVAGSDIANGGGRLPAANISAMLAFDRLTVIAMYAQTLKDVKATLSNEMVKLKSFNIEGSYRLPTSFPLTLAAGYSQTMNFEEVAGIDQRSTYLDPNGSGYSGSTAKKDQWVLGISTDVLKNARIGLEYANIAQFKETGSTDTERFSVVTADFLIKF